MTQAVCCSLNRGGIPVVLNNPSKDFQTVPRVTAVASSRWYAALEMDWSRRGEAGGREGEGEGRGGDCWAVALCYVSCRSRLEKRGEEEVSNNREKLKPPGGVAMLRLVFSEPSLLLCWFTRPFVQRHWWRVCVCVREEDKKDLQSLQHTVDYI